MKTSLQFFAGRPNWQVVEHRFGDALLSGELDPVRISLIEISNHEEALDLGFCGSPTGLVGRFHRTDRGLSGAPTVDQLAGSFREGEEE